LGVTILGVGIAVLLFAGVGLTLICCIGIWVMPDTYDQLHCAGPATSVAPVAIAGAVILEESLSQSGVKAVLVAAILGINGPALTHATGRAARIRERGHFMALPEEMTAGTTRARPTGS
jgi:monovalent cation/proton antiporter MnhG/PhaG subunit